MSLDYLLEGPHGNYHNIADRRGYAQHAFEWAMRDFDQDYHTIIMSLENPSKQTLKDLSQEMLYTYGFSINEGDENEYEYDYHIIDFMTSEIVRYKIGNATSSESNEKYIEDFDILKDTADDIALYAVIDYTISLEPEDEEEEEEEEERSLSQREKILLDKCEQISKKYAMQDKFTCLEDLQKAYYSIRGMGRYRSLVPNSVACACMRYPWKGVHGWAP